MGFRALVCGYGLIGIGIALIIWHGCNILKPSVREGEFEVVKKGESGWGVAVGVLMIGTGWFILHSYFSLVPR